MPKGELLTTLNEREPMMILMMRIGMGTSKTLKMEKKRKLRTRMNKALMTCRTSMLNYQAQRHSGLRLISSALVKMATPCWLRSTHSSRQ